MQFFPKHFTALAFLLGLFLVLSGCMQTRIVTDKQPSNQTAELTWAHGFVYGLVPPVNAPLDTERPCGEAGVSDVFFRQPFVQILAQGLTGSLYAPQRFTATCAAGDGVSTAATPPSYLLKKDSDLRISAGSPSPTPPATKQNREQ